MIEKQDFIDRVNAEFDKLRSGAWVDLGNRHEEEVLMGPMSITQEYIDQRGFTIDTFEESLFDTCVDGAVTNIIDKNTPDEGADEILSQEEFHKITEDIEQYTFERVSDIVVTSGDNNLDKPLYVGAMGLAGQKRNFNSIKLIDIEDFDFDLSESDEGFEFKGSGKLIISY